MTSTEAKPTRKDFIEQAIRENRPWVEANLNDTDIVRADIRWAIDVGLRHENKDVRNLAASYLMVSCLFIKAEDERTLVQVMLQDKYHIVQYRLAVAIYTQGRRQPEVVSMFAKACADPDVGPDARKYQKVT